MIHESSIRRAVHQYHLARPRITIRHQSDQLLGPNSGSSQELHEYREYRPGDDIRHLDWAAYGRSDLAMIRLYREEVGTRSQILVDTSLSMTFGAPSKAEVALNLAAIFSLLAAQHEETSKIFALGDDLPPQEYSWRSIESVSEIPFEAKSPLTSPHLLESIPSTRETTRYVFSDFLFPHDPRLLIGRLAGNSVSLTLIQVLTPAELEPDLVGGHRLFELETGDFSDIHVNREAIEQYRNRLKHLQDDLSEEATKRHAKFLTLNCYDTIETICRGPLCQSSILRAR